MLSRSLLAQLHIESLAEEDNPRAVRRALQELPEKLDQMYDEAMHRIASQGRRKTQRAEQVLSWISYAERPLTIRELQHALATEAGDVEIDEEALPDEDLPVFVCGGLVTIDRESDIVRFVHYTADEYFKRIRGSRFPSAQVKIAMTCLTYLSFEGLTSSPVYPPLFKYGPPHSNDWQVQLHKYPLLQYAASFWGNHAHDTTENTLNLQILQFLQSASNVKLSSRTRRFHSSAASVYWDAELWHIETGLQLACHFRLDDIIRLLVSSGTADVNAGDGVCNPPLHIAANHGDVKAIEILIGAGADPNQRGCVGWTALHHAVLRGHANAAKILLPVTQLLSDPWGTVDAAQPLLYLATRYGRLEIAHLLVEANTDVNCMCNDGYEGKNRMTALQRAVIEHHVEIVDALLAAGADVNVPRLSYGYPYTPLMDAAAGGGLKIVESLLNAGAKVNDPVPGQALSAAAYYGHSEIVRRLLSAGEDPDGYISQQNHGRNSLKQADVGNYRGLKAVSSRVREGGTPLQNAMNQGHGEIVKLLLLANATSTMSIAQRKANWGVFRDFIY